MPGGDVKRKTTWLCCAGMYAALLLAGCATTSPEKSASALSATLREVAESAERAYDYETAAGSFSQLYEHDPNDLRALIGMARNLRYAGLPKEAIKELKKGMAGHGEPPELLLELGKSQLAAALLNDARETLEKNLSKASGAWQAHAALGLAYDRLGRHPEAEERYGAALALSPGNVAVSNNLALSLALMGKLDQGIAVLEKIVDSENSTPQARQNLALLYAMHQELDKAERLSREDLTPQETAFNMESYRRLAGRGPLSPSSFRLPQAKSPQTQPAALQPAKQTQFEGRLSYDEGMPPLEDAPVISGLDGNSADIGGAYEAVADADVREGPSPEAAPVAHLRKGDRARLLGRAMDDAWYYVLLDSGKMGFVDQHRVRPRQGAAAP